METLHDAYVRVANDIQDNTFKLITKGEYISSADIVARSLSRYIDLFVREIEYVSTADVFSFVLSDVRSIHITNNNLTVPKDTDYHAVKLLKVVRHNQDCREVSWTAIESAKRGNSAFKTNDTELDYRFYATRLLPTGEIELHWALPLAKDEKVTVFALCDIPKAKTYATINETGATYTPKWSEFRDYTPIPDLLFSLFYKALLAEILGILLVRFGENWANKLAYATANAKAELYEVRKYISSLKDKSSMGQIQPLKWLAEDDNPSMSTGNAGIPPEYYSKVIV